MGNANCYHPTRAARLATPAALRRREPRAGIPVFGESLEFIEKFFRTPRSVGDYLTRVAEIPVADFMQKASLGQ